jgi:hypothetical protein
MAHDYCYEAVENCKTCPQQNDSPAKLTCDHILLKCVDKLKGKSPDMWPKPPPGDGSKAYIYCQKLKRYFEWKVGK